MLQIHLLQTQTLELSQRMARMCNNCAQEVNPALVLTGSMTRRDVLEVARQASVCPTCFTAVMPFRLNDLCRRYLRRMTMLASEANRPGGDYRDPQLSITVTVCPPAAAQGLYPW